MSWQTHFAYRKTELGRDDVEETVVLHEIKPKQAALPKKNARYVCISVRIEGG